jgi:hypothetical protein
MTCDTVDRRPFHSSVGGLMIAIAVCALLLVPVGWMARERALRKAWQMRAHAARLRAIALEERYRAEHLVQIRARQRGAAPAAAEAAPGTARAGWPSP